MHGIGFLIVGAKPKFGAGFTGVMPYAYATSDRQISVGKMLFVAYLPFVSLSVIFIALAYAFPQYYTWFLVGFVGNFSGAIADLWIAGKMFQFLKFNNVLVQDTKIGLDVYSSDPGLAKLIKKQDEKTEDKTPFYKTWVVTTFSLLAIQLIAPVIMMWFGFKGSFTFGSQFFNLFVANVADDGFFFQLELLSPILAGGLTALVYTLALRFRKK